MLELPNQPTIPKMPNVCTDNTEIFDKLIDIERTLKELLMLKTEIKIEDRKDRLDIIDILFKNDYYAWVESRKDGFYVCWER